MSRPFTPREPARSRLMGAEAVKAMSWHDTVEPLNLDEFQLELNAVVFDALTISRARQSPATVTRSREQVDSIAIGASFYFVRSGSFFVEQGDQRFTAGPGTAFQLSGFEPFTLTNSDVIDVSLVVMSRGIFDSVGFAEYEGLSRKLRPTPLTRAVTHFLTGLSSDLPSPDTVEGNTVKETLRGLIIGILQSAIHIEGAEEAKIPAILAKATSAISQNYSNPALRTSDIAEASGVSVRHLQRLLALSDSSVAAQLKERRLAAATALLTDPNWSASTLESIASATGFGSVSRMRRTFQSEFGVNPTEFRASAFKPEPTHAFLR